MKKLKRAKKFKDPKLAFVDQYKYTLGIGDLVPFGAAQYVLGLFLFCVHLHAYAHFPFRLAVSRSFDAGQEHFVRYTGLVSEETLPFIRASESDRVIDSAGNWTAGEK